MRERNKGLVLTALGVLALSPEALLIRLVGIDGWTLVFWRGVLLAAVLALLLLYRHGRDAGRIVLRCGAAGWIAAACLGANGVLFVFAVGHTAAANLFAIGSIAPLLAALAAWLLLGERIAGRTWLAVLACMVGVAAILGGSVAGDGLAGDLAALGAAACMAGTFVALRAAPGLDNHAVLLLGALLSVIISLPFAAPAAVPVAAWPYLLLLGLVIGPVAFTLVTLGPRYLPAAEVTLLLLLELPLAPFLVWLALDERPVAATWWGASLILLTLLLHYAAELRAARAQMRVP